MERNYQTLYKSGTAELIEKKSKFIASAYPAGDEAEALLYIEAIKKRHWNASHHCYAYVLGEKRLIERYSDDGEPGGTAGKPILEVITGSGLTNTLIIVTRYFGGTLLGTGGLVRAYGGAAKEALAAGIIITKIYAVRVSIQTPYTGLGKIQYLLAEREVSVLDTCYTDRVTLEVLVPVDRLDEVGKALVDGTSGQVELKKGESCYYSKVDKEIIIFTK